MTVSGGPDGVSVTSDTPGTYRPAPHYPPPVLVAAAPSWFADNLAIIAAGVLLLVTFLVLRMVKERVTRTILLGVIALVAVLVYVNRDPLKACAETCECQIADQDLSVPFCDPNFELSSAITRASLRA